MIPNSPGEFQRQKNVGTMEKREKARLILALINLEQKNEYIASVGRFALNKLPATDTALCTTFSTSKII